MQARLEETMFLECGLEGADFSGGAFHRVIFMKSALRGIKAREGTYGDWMTVDCDLS